MELTDKNYTTIIKNSDKPVFIEFYSPSCAPCQTLKRLIDEKLEKYGEENGVKVVKCNVNKNPKLSNAFNIKSIPFTIVVMPNNEKLKYPDIGLRDESYYFSIIDKLAGKSSFFSRLFS